MEKVVTPLTINMRTLREAQHIPAKEMANYLGKALSTYRNYESGYYPVPGELIAPIAERLGVTQEELLAGTPFPTATERKKKEDPPKEAGKIEPPKAAEPPKTAREGAPKIVDRETFMKKGAPAWPAAQSRPAAAAPEDVPGMTRIEGTGTLFDEFYVLLLEPEHRRAILEYEEELPPGAEEEIYVYPEEDLPLPPPEEEVHVDDLFADYFAMAENMVFHEPSDASLGLGLAAFERAARLPEKEEIPKEEPQKEEPKKVEIGKIEERKTELRRQEQKQTPLPRQVETPKQTETKKAEAVAEEKKEKEKRIEQEAATAQEASTVEETKTGQLSFDLPLFGGNEEEKETKPKARVSRKQKEKEEREEAKRKFSEETDFISIDISKLFTPKKAFHPAFHVQRTERESLLLEQVKAKVEAVMPDVDVIYVKPGENRAYWTKGHENGFVTLWD